MMLLKGVPGESGLLRKSVMEERPFRNSSAEDMRTPLLTRKPTDMAAVAKTPITTDLLDCLTNTERPPISSVGCAGGLRVGSGLLPTFIGD